MAGRVGGRVQSGLPLLGNKARRASRNDPTVFLICSRPYIDHVIAGRHDVYIVFDHDYSIASLYNFPKSSVDQAWRAALRYQRDAVQRRFVQYVNDAE
jgi:hypothetical protein